MPTAPVSEGDQKKEEFPVDKLIITIAPTGNVPTKKINPSTPVTPEEIVEDLHACEEMGASVAHIHVRDAAGKPTSERALFKQVLDLMDEKNLQIIRQVSTGARGGGNTAEWRSQMLDLNIEMASLSTGSSNFPNGVNANTPDLVEYLINKMTENHVKPEIEAFDVAMIDNAKFLLKKGVLKAPLHFNLVMNVPGSIAGTPKNLMHMIESLPQGSTFSVMGVGKAQVQMLAIAIVLGGHIRTGLEDVLTLKDRSPASNQLLVQQVLDIAKAVGREIATPAEARQMLGLKPL